MFRKENSREKWVEWGLEVRKSLMGRKISWGCEKESGKIRLRPYWMAR